MSVKLILTIAATLFLISCQPGKEEKILKKFSDEYIDLLNRYEENISTAGNSEQYKTYRFQKASECDQLLRKYSEQVSGDAAELLKSKLAIESSRFDEAEPKITGLIDNSSPLINEAKLAQVRMLIYQDKPNEALSILREIQDKVKPGLELLSSYLYFALYSRDINVIEEYAGKFLSSPAIPRALNSYTPDVYHSLSSVALFKNDMEKSVKDLEKAISETKDQVKKLKWQSELTRLQIIGNPAPPIFAETWLNSYPIDTAQLKGNVTLITFWAPWCNYSRQAIPGLTDLYRKYKDKGVVIIGLTKLYGNYKDDAGDKGILSDKDEIALIKEFLSRYQVFFPVAVAMESINSENYKIKDIPSFVFINKRGKIAYIMNDAREGTFIENEINRLLEEK